MIIAIRLRSTIKARREIIDTLKMLRLNRRMHSILIKETDSTKGMLMKVRDYITWGDISEENLKKLILKRGRKPGNKRLTKEEVEGVIKDLEKGSREWKIKPVFRLSPPSKGFKKSTKQHFPKGELGYRGENINKLIERMI